MHVVKSGLVVIESIRLHKLIEWELLRSIPLDHLGDELAGNDVALDAAHDMFTSPEIIVHIKGQLGIRRRDPEDDEITTMAGEVQTGVHKRRETGRVDC